MSINHIITSAMQGLLWGESEPAQLGRGSFTLVRRERRVGPDLSTHSALMLKSLHTLLIRSLMPAT